jgi:hypothetical protein
MSFGVYHSNSLSFALIVFGKSFLIQVTYVLHSLCPTSSFTFFESYKLIYFLFFHELKF